jgi:6-phosphogluconolactonase
MITVREFPDVQTLNHACEAVLRDVLQQGGGPRAVMLSGGRTPLALFNQIAAAPFPIAPGAHLAYTDDRHVPADSPDSNFGATLPMITALGMPLENVLRVHTELPLEAAAEKMHADFEAFFAKGGSIPVAFLGLGADGHTCSLFTQDDIDRGVGRFASPTPRPTPPARVTVTPELLQRCGKIIFLVTGADKSAVVGQLLHTPDEIPAGRATAQCADVHLWRA